MKLYTLSASQQLPITLAQAWEFFSAPRNLAELTPASLKFTVTHGDRDRIFPGAIIRYTIMPFPFVRMQWVTEITHVDPMRFFVDEQRFGPYRFWHHLHRFEEIEGGVLVSDLVHYAIPFGPLGRLFHPVLVRPQLERIFSFRRETLVRRFGSMPDTR